MKSLLRIGLAMLVFVATLSLAPAASAWQTGRVPRSALAWEMGRGVAETGATIAQPSIDRQATSAAVRSGTDVVALSAALNTADVSANSSDASAQGYSWVLGGHLGHSRWEALHRLRLRAHHKPKLTVRHNRAAPHPTPTAYPSPGDPQVPVPANATKSQIDACMAQARADGPGTWVVFPAGKFAYTGTIVVPDRVNLTGQGIWDQGAAGGGGTWLRCPIKWGSYSTIANLLLGFNAPGKTCTFTPCARDDAACGTYTQAHGSTGCTFSFVRFKGGSDTGRPLLDLGSNHVGTSTTIKTCDMIDTSWYDCEFERPQAANSVNASSSFPFGNPGNCLNLWIDDRVGGAQVYGDSWIRCHFGVKNGYHTGIDGYGCGSSCPFMQIDSNMRANTTGGSIVTTANINPACDWSLTDHGFRDMTFTDCLFEYATWYSADICDSARDYSMWMGTMAYLKDHPGGTDTTGGASYGWGNPPGSQWVDIPDRIWNLRIDMTRCYHKGNLTGTGYGGKVWGAKEICGEIGRNCTITDTTLANGASLFNQAGHYGNSRTGTYPTNTRPTSPIFTADWRGATTSYTPSPYDP